MLLPLEDARHLVTSQHTAAPDPERILVIGASYRDGSTDARQAAAATLPTLPEQVVLRTCHRIELIGIGDIPGGPLPAPLRVSQGRDAVVRTMRIVAGLDSAIVAEEQLLGQVRDAYQTALAAGSSGPLLNELLQRALRVGRQARSIAGPATDRSLADRALSRVATPRRALVVGSGAMAARLVAALTALGAGVTVASTSLERAGQLAVRHAAQATSWHVERLGDGWDLVVFATRIADPLLDDAGRLGTAAVIDLCAPPAVAASARRQLGARLVDLDTLGMADDGDRRSTPAVRRIEARIEEEADRYLAWMVSRGAADQVALLHARAAELRDRYVGRLRRSDRFDAGQIAVVERMTAQLVGELLHEPTLRLRTGREV